MYKDLYLKDEALFAELNELSEINSEVINKWKQEIKEENWNGLLVFKNSEGYYYVPFDTREEMKKIVNYYESIDFFVGKIDMSSGNK